MAKISLAGGAEFGGGMAVLDRSAIESAGGWDITVSVIPAAAAPDNNHDRAGANGVEWFQKLGVANARALPLIERSSADHPEIVAALHQSDLIYLLGGFPAHLASTLNGSQAWGAILTALENGTVVSGSSAGAMVLCEHFYDPHRDEILSGLGLIPGVCVLPHHDTFGKTWAPRLRELLPGTILIGIDEQTGLLSKEDMSEWRVHGKGSVVIYQGDQTFKSGNEDVVNLS